MISNRIEQIIKLHTPPAEEKSHQLYVVLEFKDDKEKFIRDYRIKIGDAIKNIREKKGYSQDELAEIMNVNRSTISKIENGKFNLSIDYLLKFSWFLDFEFQLKETNNNKSVTQI